MKTLQRRKSSSKQTLIKIPLSHYGEDRQKIQELMNVPHAVYLGTAMPHVVDPCSHHCTLFHHMTVAQLIGWFIHTDINEHLQTLQFWDTIAIKYTFLSEHVCPFVSACAYLPGQDHLIWPQGMELD